jgi:hypothetical protein
VPQPLSSVTSKHITMSISPDVLQDLPELAAGVGRVIAAFSYLEVLLGESLAKLLGAKAESGVAMYLSLTSTAGQFAILEAAAQTNLKGGRRDIFFALMALVRSVAKERNKIAHGLWAKWYRVTDKVLLIPPRAHLELAGKREAGRRGASGIERDQIMVYDLGDFDRLHGRIDALAGHFHTFSMLVDNLPRSLRSWRVTQWRKLRNELDVRQALSQLRRRQRSK